MKNMITILLVILITSAFSQPTEKTAQEKMKPFTHWVGQWKGEGSMQMGPGEPKKSNVDEKIEMKLNGTIVVIEGIGKTVDPSTNKEIIVHHAFAILSYDHITNQYKMRSHLKDGRSTDAWFNVVNENEFQWGFDFPQGKMRYTINIDGDKKTWNEIGEFSRDGNSWFKSLTMKLTKVD